MAGADKWESVRGDLAKQYSIDLVQLEASVDRIVTQAKNQPKSSLVEIYNDDKVVITSDNKIPPLDTIDASKAVLDRRIEVRHIEQNADELAKYLDICAAIRKEYASATKEYLEAKVKLEEFFRLDQIHRLEVEAGLYEMPWREAQDQLTALEKIIVPLSESQKSISELLSTGALSSANILDFVNNSAELTGHSVREASAGVAKELSKKTINYRSGVEVQQWARINTVGSSELEKLKAQRSIEKRRVKYLQQDVTFKQNRTAVARDLSYQRLAYHAQPGGALNHGEALGNMRLLFDSYLNRIISRAVALEKGLLEFYKIELKLPDLSGPRLIDRLILWFGKVHEEMLIRRRSERVGIFSVSLKSEINSKWRERLAEGVEITFPPGRFGTPSYVRGVAADYTGEIERPVGLEMGKITPEGAWDKFYLGRINNRNATPEPSPSFGHAVWNREASGKWYFKTPVQLSNDIEDIQIALWVAN